MTLEKSFKSVSTWIKQINEKLNNPYLISFGNKIDIDKPNGKLIKKKLKNLLKKKCHILKHQLKIIEVLKKDLII